ncbi:MAG: PEP-CTERM sorting domain-containing protein [Pseudomonadota bacterium]
MIKLLGLIAASAMLVLSAAPARAQSSAEAGISNIIIQLSDLDPADGIAPSLTYYNFQFGPIAGWEIYDEHARDLRGDTNTASTPLAPVSISHSRNELPHLRSELAAGIRGATLADTSLFASASTVDTIGANTSSAYLQSQNVWFALSPHTRVTLTADLSVRSSAGPIAGPGLHAVAYASAAMALFSWSENVSQTAQLYHNAVFGENRGPGWDRTYSVSVSNNSASGSDYVMGMSVNARTYTSTVIPAPVPEPASMLMLLAGLGILAIHRRRSS